MNKTTFNAPQVAEAILGQVDWRDPLTGYCHCPGEHLHSHRTGTRDCRVSLDGAPTLFCFHTSCAAIVEATNFNLRSTLAKGAAVTPWRPSESDRERQRAKEANERLKARAKASLHAIVAEFAIGLADLWEASPVRLEGEPQNDWRLHLSLFTPDDVVWCGNVFDSGKPHNARNFRPVGEWLEGSKAPGNFTCGSAFKNNCFTRSNDNVIARRFLVIESDTLSREEMLAVISWCRQFMTLRAVVDTGGKSLHGWFTYPSGEVINELKTILPELGCDPALFKASQPCRLAGAWREEKGKWQTLLFFDPKGGAQ